MINFGPVPAHTLNDRPIMIDLSSTVKGPTYSPLVLHAGRKNLLFAAGISQHDAPVTRPVGLRLHFLAMNGFSS